MNDIKNREDLEILLSKFYSKLLSDETISYIFTDVAKINLKSHLPKIIDFWNVTARTNYFNVHLRNFILC